jgi:hypothetical protein
MLKPSILWAGLRLARLATTLLTSFTTMVLLSRFPLLSSSLIYLQTILPHRASAADDTAPETLFPLQWCWCQCLGDSLRVVVESNPNALSRNAT